MKNTKTVDPYDWLLTRKSTDHTVKLIASKGQRLTGGNLIVSPDKLEIHFFVPKTVFTDGMEAQWQAAFKSIYPDLDKLVLTTIEEGIKL